MKVTAEDIICARALIEIAAPDISDQWRYVDGTLTIVVSAGRDRRGSYPVEAQYEHIVTGINQVIAFDQPLPEHMRR